MNDKNGQRGTIMVEAALVFPVVIVTVAAIMVLGMMKFQESLVQFGAQKMASAAARDAVYPNYWVHIGGSDGMEIDLESFPEPENVIAYYKDNTLYTSFSKDTKGIEKDFEDKLEKFVRDYSFLAGMNVKANVNINGFIVPVVSVTVDYTINLPGFLGFIGLPNSWPMQTGAYAFAGNPTEFVRNVDIAVDVTTFFLEKLGFKDRVDIFMEKLDSVMKKIGGKVE